MGETWRAASGDQQGVVKRARGPAPTTEFRILSQLDHPGVPHVVSCGVDGGSFWLATEWIEGRPLEQGLPPGADPDAFASAAVHTMLYLADCGITHGDVHPANLLGSATGYPLRLVDFGLAVEGPGAPAGRPGFIAPEVLTGSPRSLATDLFGLGASLRAAGLPGTGVLGDLAAGLLSRDPAARTAAARAFASERPRPQCGPRRTCRADEERVFPALLDRAESGVVTLLVHGPEGMGKSGLLQALCLHGLAAGWKVDRRRDGDESSLALRWSEGAGRLLVALDDADVHGDLDRALRAAGRLGDSGVKGVLVALASGTRPETWDGPAIALGPIGQEHVGDILRQVTGVSSLRPQDLASIARSASGNPGQAVALARELLSAGAVEFRAGAWNLRPLETVPVTLDSAIAARSVVARLEEEHVRALAAVSLAAGQVPLASLPTAAACRAAIVEELLSSGLARREGISAVPRDPALGHASVERLPRPDRQAIHQRLALLCRELGAPRWVVAWHWVRSGNRALSAAEALAGARDLVVDGDPHGARQLLLSARPLSDGSAREELEAALIDLDADERPSEQTAREAEALALSASSPKVSRRMAQLAIIQWFQLRRADQMEAAGSRLLLPGGEDAQRSLRLARAILSGADDVSEEALEEFGGSSRCDELMFLAWIHSRRGKFRAAVRTSLRALRVALRGNLWRQVGTSTNFAAGRLVSLGKPELAGKILAHVDARVGAISHPSVAASLRSAQATLHFALGHVRRALELTRECDRLFVLCGAAPDRRGSVQVLRAQLLRFAGKPHLALETLAGCEDGLAPSQRPWAAYPRLVSHLDQGHARRALEAAAEGIEGFTRLGDKDGISSLSAYRAIASREAGDTLAWRAQAEALPERIPDDGVAEGTCAWVRGEAALERGDRSAARAEFARVARLAEASRLVGTEVVARSAAACAAAGDFETGRALLARVVEVPDSPCVEVWVTVARARLEATGFAALRTLEPVRPLLPEAGLPARRAWLLAAADAGERCGRLEEAESWRRQAAMKEEDGMNSNVIASQTRYIRDIIQDINSERSIGPLVDKILDAALGITGAERGCLVLIEAGASQLKAARPPGADPRDGSWFSQTISDRVLRSNEALYSGDALHDRRLSESTSIPRLQVHSVLCVPFRIKGNPIGTLYVDHRRKADAFDPAALDALQTMADLAAVAIENARLFEENARQRAQLEDRAKRLEERLEAVEHRAQTDEAAGLQGKYPSIVGRGPAMIHMLKAVDRAAEHTLPVLIHGETGSGKELVARALHDNGSFRDGPFVAENCAAISPMLMESELFGHVKGAFTGSVAQHEGLFRRADGGTLFLDEIGELEPSLQAKLLRVLEDGLVRPVGADRPVKVRLRVLAATHRDLEAMVAAGKFRGDLFYRLASFRIEVPPLREHPEDIPELVRGILERQGGCRVTEEAMKMLVGHEWKGNVRELQHALLVLARPGVSMIGVEDVVASLTRFAGKEEQVSETLTESLEKVRAARVRSALLAAGGRISVAARQLGLSYQGVRKIARKHKLFHLKELSKSLNGNSKLSKRKLPE